MVSRLTPSVAGAGRIMITDGGSHPAELWAQMVVDDICQLGPNLDPKQQAAALRMQADMMEALTPLFELLLTQERDALHGDLARIASGVDPAPHLDDCLKAVLGAAAGTRWEPLFSDDENVMKLRQLLGQHIASLMHTERSWHADRNPGHDAAVAFRQLHHPGPGEV